MFLKKAREKLRSSILERLPELGSSVSSDFEASFDATGATADELDQALSLVNVESNQRALADPESYWFLRSRFSVPWIRFLDAIVMLQQLEAGDEINLATDALIEHFSSATPDISPGALLEDPLFVELERSDILIYLSWLSIIYLTFSRRQRGRAAWDEGFQKAFRNLSLLLVFCRDT